MAVSRPRFISKIANDFAGFTRLKPIARVELKSHTRYLKRRCEHEGWKWIGSDEVAVLIKEIQPKNMFTLRPGIVHEGDVGLALEGHFLSYEDLTFFVQASQLDDKVV